VGDAARAARPHGDPQIIRIRGCSSRGSELSWRLLVCTAAAVVVVYGLTRWASPSSR
jgi:hypothetical protein